MVGWDAALTRIATWVKLQDKKTGQILMVVNTHFDHIGTEARRNSALLIIEKLKKSLGLLPLFSPEILMYRKTGMPIKQLPTTNLF